MTPSEVASFVLREMRAEAARRQHAAGHGDDPALWQAHYNRALAEIVDLIEPLRPWRRRVNWWMAFFMGAAAVCVGALLVSWARG